MDMRVVAGSGSQPRYEVNRARPLASIEVEAGQVFEEPETHKAAGLGIAVEKDGFDDAEQRREESRVAVIQPSNEMRDEVPHVNELTVVRVDGRRLNRCTEARTGGGAHGEHIEVRDHWVLLRLAACPTAATVPSAATSSRCRLDGFMN
jgi:hypothetical protein